MGDGECSDDETAESCPDDCDAECGDGACTHDETAEFCPTDCPPGCDDGLCTDDETAESCPDDCPADCGDGLCTHEEDASGCGDDCPAECGDELCTHDETAESCEADCPSDCGDEACTHEEDAASCSDDCPAVCGDEACTHDEDPTTCADDCPDTCGDLICTGEESAATCEDDCEAVCGDEACTHEESACDCADDCAATCGDACCTHEESAAACGEDCEAVCGDEACTHEESACDCADDCAATCGDACCTHEESPATCGEDCAAVCGDDACTHDETALTCDADCLPVCGDGGCTHDETPVTCGEDCPAVCGDVSCTHDESAITCAADCPAVCGDGGCTHAETPVTCGDDCPAVCGDAMCTHDESATACAADCPAICGDGACTHAETPVTCEDDCPGVCGDAMCTHDESATTCVADCPAVCGDGACTHAEDIHSCPDDCPAVCGDGECTHDEDEESCPVDCGSGACGDGVVGDEEECDDGNDERCDGCSPDCTVELGWSRGALLLRDSAEIPGALTDLLDREGFTHTARNNGAGVVTADVDALLAYPMVVFYNHDRAISAAEQTALDLYVQCGGVLLATGYDSMGHPTDTRLAAVARVTTSGDSPFSGACRVSNDSHPATTGPYGDYSVGSTFSVARTDHDNVQAGGASTELVTVSTADKLTWAGDVGEHHGQVYYWNGNENLLDWTTAGDPQNIFLNILDWHLHSLGIVYDGGTAPAAFTGLLASNCFTYGSYNNAAGTRTGSFWWLHRHPVTIFRNFDRAISADEETALTQYVENGGTLIVTGYDSMGHPTDERLANVCHVTTTGDGPFAGACSVTDGAHPALDGPFGTYAAGTAFAVAQTDHDSVTASDELGSVELIAVAPADKLTYAADVGFDGAVYYWNGNALMNDWTVAGVPQNILLNLLDAEIERASACGGGFGPGEALVPGRTDIYVERAGWSVTCREWSGDRCVHPEMRMDCAVCAAYGACGEWHDITNFNNGSQRTSQNFCAIATGNRTVVAEGAAGATEAPRGCGWGSAAHPECAADHATYTAGFGIDGSLGLLLNEGYCRNSTTFLTIECTGW